MDNIVNFPQNLESSRRELKELPARRGDALRAAHAGKKTFSPEDQLRAASNLQKLFETLQSSHGITKRQVVEACGMGGSGREDSTKRLYEYTLPLEASEKRKSKVAKKSGKYFEIATAIAKLAGSTEDEILSRIFHGCSYATGSSFGAGADWDEVRWSTLSRLLIRMGEAVVSKANMARYWDLAERVAARYNPVSDKFETSPEPLDMLGCEAGLVGAVEDPADIPPVPSVLLAEIQLAEITAGLCSTCDDLLAIAEFKLTMEIRLAIVPISFDEIPGPVFEFRLKLDAFNSDGHPIEHDRVVTLVPCCDGNRYAAQFDGEGVQIELHPDIPVPQCVFFHDEWRSNYRAWGEINPALLRDLFEKFEHRTTMAWIKDGKGYQSLLPSRFTIGTPGSCLHTELIGGTMENKLMQVSKKLRDQMLELQSQITDQISEMENKAEKRWLKET